jgi:cytoskeleton protein RodZ
MSDSTMDPVAAEPSQPTTAGGLLRQARQAQGLHIAALAAAIKVVPRKLELLESDQFDQLPDATFTRALANTVCRTLKIDAAPILALLPPLPGHRLEHVAEGLKTPFEEGQGGGSSSSEGSLVGTPVLVLAGVLVVAAIAVYVAPASWLKWPGRSATTATESTSAAPASAAAAAAGDATPAAAPATSDLQGAAPAADAASGADPVMPPGSEATTSPESESEGAAAAADASAPKAAGVLQLTVSDASWIEVVDARGKALISRLVPAGESVSLDGAMPFKLKIGNANATQVVFRGQPLDLAPFTRDNMAKLQLK